MRSIRRFLLGSLLSTLLLVLGLTVWLGYRETAHEVEEMFDAELVTTARVLKGVINRPAEQVRWQDVIRALDEAQLPDAPLPDYIRSYEKKLALQVWSQDGRQLLLRSAAAPEQALAPLHAGFFERHSNGHHWHVYTGLVPVNGFWLLVAERSDARDELSEHIATTLLASGLLGLLLAAALVWVVVGRGLAPLIELRRAIASRELDRLEPVNLSQNPQEIAPVVDALNLLLARLAEGLERERRFVADAAHELRTPLAVLKLQAQHLKTQAPPTLAAHCDKLLAGVDRGTRVVEQLLMLARLDAQQELPGTEAIDLTTVCRDTLASLAPLTLARQQQLVFVADETRPLILIGSATLLGMLLRNLVDNAMRHTPASGEILVQLERQAQALRLQVSDSGPGVPADQLGRLTERFYRHDTHDQQGTGLGLAIVARITELHHGHLHFTNRDAGGLCVTVDFPAPPTTTA